MARLWARRVSFESVSVGDQLPILVKSETRERIERFDRPAAGGSPGLDSHSTLTRSTGDSGPDPDEEPTYPIVAEAAVTPGPALVAYVAELLEKAFPLTALLARGSRLEVEAIRPVGDGDTITLSGQVVGKREEGGLRLVECEILVENQAGQLVARALAVVPL
jgi:hypothetical protein